VRKKTIATAITISTIAAAILFRADYAVASKNCVVSISILPSQSVDFDSMGEPTSYNIQLNSGNKSCTYYVYFSLGNAGSLNRTIANSSGATIRYGIFKAPCSPSVPSCTNPQIRDSGTTGEVIFGSMAKNSTITIPFYPVYPLEPVNTFSSGTAIKPWGTYTDTLTVSAYDSLTGEPYQIAASTNLTLSKTIAKFAKVAIVDQGSVYSDPPPGGHLFDFGTMTTTSVQSFDIASLYNAGYALSLASQNGSKMKETSSVKTIDYEVRVNGVLKTLSAGVPVTVASGGGTSPSVDMGTRTPLQITVPQSSITSALGGTYEDTITVTITSTE
jgi:hypothetical protein